MPFGTKTVEKNSSRDSLKAALGRQPLVAAVDLGASKVSCFIMKPEGVRRADRTLTAAGVGYVQSRGIRGGAIVNLSSTATLAGSPGQWIDYAGSKGAIDIVTKGLEKYKECSCVSPDAYRDRFLKFITHIF